MALCNSTGREVSYEWSHRRISSTDSEFRDTLKSPSRTLAVKGLRHKVLSKPYILHMDTPLSYGQVSLSNDTYSVSLSYSTLLIRTPLKRMQT